MGKNALEQLLSSYNWWMGASTIAVALGILGEYVAHFIFEEEARRNKREMAISVLFGALVLGGVVGEYIFGKRLTQVSEQLQQIADEAVAKSNKDAAQARRDAETAKGDASKADEKAGKANARAGRLEKEAAGLRIDAESLRAQNLSTVQKLVESRKALDDLEIAIKPRSIWIRVQNGHSDLDKLSEFAGMTFSIDVISDNEAVIAANDLASTLQSARWGLDGAISVEQGIDPRLFREGVYLFCRSYAGIPTPESEADHSCDAAEALREFLIDQGWDANLRLLGPLAQPNTANALRITVGVLPATHFLPENVRKLIEDSKQREDKALRDLNRKMKSINH
jgi:hypothetical protein